MDDSAMIPPQDVEYGSFKSYLVGFILSLLLSFGAYYIVSMHLLVGLASDITVSVLAIVQATVQLLLFLNLTRESPPRWNMIVFFFMIMVVVILVFGSLWIMKNLDYNLMLK